MPGFFVIYMVIILSAVFLSCLVWLFRYLKDKKNRENNTDNRIRYNTRSDIQRHKDPNIIAYFNTRGVPFEEIRKKAKEFHSGQNAEMERIKKEMPDYAKAAVRGEYIIPGGCGVADAAYEYFTLDYDAEKINADKDYVKIENIKEYEPVFAAGKPMMSVLGYIRNSASICFEKRFKMFPCRLNEEQTAAMFSRYGSHFKLYGEITAVDKFAGKITIKLAVPVFERGYVPPEDFKPRVEPAGTNGGDFQDDYKAQEEFNNKQYAELKRFEEKHKDSGKNPECFIVDFDAEFWRGDDYGAKIEDINEDEKIVTEGMPTMYYDGEIETDYCSVYFDNFDAGFPGNLNDADKAVLFSKFGTHFRFFGIIKSVDRTAKKIMIELELPEL